MGAHDPFRLLFFAYSFVPKPKPQRILTKGYSRLRGGEHQREKSSRGNSLPEGEIDAIAIVIERDIISITIIIISTIYTAITTAAPLADACKGYNHNESSIESCQHLLLLVGIDILTYRRYCDTPPILVGHQEDRDRKSRFVLKKLKTGQIPFRRDGKPNCPFCGRVFPKDIESLIQHATGVGKGSAHKHKAASKAKHAAFGKFLRDCWPSCCPLNLVSV
ncbi:hypothetical protein QYE76_024129 [Lolium multiflorum]|uniref:Zinc finger-XS domain-containing protein n=1 Tax=Lolium multiflorum TaxID=4521 RepID=A0AAD8RE88_LOLMU|nr:hypothetical protein QYE76_024129 [Lolium multiflorum]